MKKTIKFFWVNWFLVLVILGCKKFVSVDAPVTKLVSSSVFSSDATATVAQLSIYSSMINESYNMALNCGLLSDEFINYNSGLTRVYINDMDAVNNSSNGPWGNAYNYIYNANAMIEGLASTLVISEAAKKQLGGEARFVRAFWYFYLVNCYGDVPEAITTDYSINSTIPRKHKAEVYSQIIDDLNNAEDMLSAQFVNLTDSIATNERVRPTKWAAKALLARVYLYLGQYSKAESLTTEVINSGLFSLISDLGTVFLKNSNEAIWQLQIPLPTDYNTPDGFGFILNSDPSDVTLSSQLIGSFESGDKRRIAWIKDTTFSGIAYSYAYKYKVYLSSNVSEYVMILRLAEQYLIRAEARAQQGNLAGVNSAISDLDTIRGRAGLGHYMGLIDKDSVLAALLHERQVELFTEWGHRWFDLIRTGQVNMVMSVVTPLKGGVWNKDGHQSLYPIPRTEILKDGNLTQNPGYQ